MNKKRTSADIVLDPEKKGPVINAVDALLDILGPKDADGNLLPKPNKFPVTLHGITLLFRFPNNSGDLNAFEKGMFEFVLRLKDKEFLAGCLKPYKDALAIRTLDDDDLCTAYTIHYWSHPDLRIEESQSLRMVACNPSVARQVMKQVDDAINQGALVINFGGVYEKKETSLETKPNESG